MRISILTSLFLFMIGSSQSLAYSVRDFVFPRLHNKITLTTKTGSTLTVSHGYSHDTMRNRFNSVHFSSKEALSINDYKKAVGFLFEVDGSKLKLKNYELENSSYLVTSKKANSKVWFSIPKEAWSTTEHEFVKPTNTYENQTSKSSFKKVKARNGTEYFSLIVQVYQNKNRVYTLVFAQGVGLLQYITKSGSIYENNLWYETIAGKFKKTYSSETDMRKASWKYYKRVTAYMNDTTGKTEYNSYRNRLVKRGIDTLSAFYLGLSYKNSSMTDFGNYLTSSRIEKYLFSYHASVISNKSKMLNIEMGEYAKWGHYLMPSYNSSTASSLKKYVTKIDQNYKLNYLRILSVDLEHMGNKSMYKALSSYEVGKMISLGKLYLKEMESDKTTNENVYNYLAFAYQREGNKDLDLYYNALAAEEFAKFSDDSKTDNIDYAKRSIDDLVAKSTQDEAIHIRSMKALLGLNAEKEALEKAQKGYNQGFESKDFAFAYADIALRQKKKIDLRKALELIEKHSDNLTASDKGKLVEYYRFLGEEDMVRKYEKERKEKEALAAKEKAKQDRKNKRRRNGSPVGLSISTNPANLLWNTFPLAVDLRLGRSIHQFRVNNHNEHKSSTLFGNYSLNYEIDDRKEWVINSGRDYSYSILFPASEGMVVGIQGFYGDLNLKPETAVGTRLTDNKLGSVDISPNVKRYGAAMQFGYRLSDRRKHYYFAFYYLFGVGYRTMDYQYKGTTDIADDSVFEFREDAKSYGYRHENWNKVYGIFNLRMRMGITLF